MNAEPVHSGTDGADEPPTLTKEDLLSSGTVRRSTPDTQVNFLKMGLRKTKTLSLIKWEMNKIFWVLSHAVKID